MPDNNFQETRNDTGVFFSETHQDGSTTHAAILNDVSLQEVNRLIGEQSDNAPNIVAPNAGAYPLPHTRTFAAQYLTPAKSYLSGDQALVNNREHATAMLQELVIAESVERRREAVAQIPCNVEAYEDKEKHADTVALVNKILNRIPRFQQFRETALWAIWYGRYALQYEWKKIKIDGQYYNCIENWMPINGDKLVFPMDGKQNGSRLGVRVAQASVLKGPRSNLTSEQKQRIHASEYGWAYFLTPWEQANHFCIHRHRIEDGIYEDARSGDRVNGVGVRDAVYWTWYQMQNVTEWMLNFIERSAFGVELWYYPSGNEKARVEVEEAARRKMSNGRNQIFIPRYAGPDSDLFGLEMITPPMNGVESCRGIVEQFYGHKIKRYILGQTLTSEASSTGLGSGLSDLQYATWNQIISSDAVRLEQTLTDQLLKSILRANLPGEVDAPIRFSIAYKADDAAQRIEVAEKLFRMGMPISRSQLREITGFREPEDEKDTVRSEDMVVNGGTGTPKARDHAKDLADKEADMTYGRKSTNKKPGSLESTSMFNFDKGHRSDR